MQSRCRPQLRRSSREGGLNPQKPAVWRSCGRSEKVASGDRTRRTPAVAPPDTTGRGHRRSPHRTPPVTDTGGRPGGHHRPSTGPHSAAGSIRATRVCAELRRGWAGDTFPLHGTGSEGVVSNDGASSPRRRPGNSRSPSAQQRFAGIASAKMRWIHSAISTCSGVGEIPNRR